MVRLTMDEVYSTLVFVASSCRCRVFALMVSLLFLALSRLSSIFTMYDMCSRGIRELRRGFGEIMAPDSLQYIASQEIAACELQIMV